MSSISSENMLDVERKKKLNPKVRQMEVNPERISSPEVLHRLI